MMKARNIIFPLLFVFAVLFSASACDGVGSSSKAPVELELSQKRTGFGDIWPYLTITSIVDSVTIQDVKLNRGNVTWTEANKFPKTLKFGRSIGGHFLATLKEVEVQTDKGTWTFTFD